MGHMGVDRKGVDGAVEWWRGAVLYQVYPRSFQDSDGDGVGDLPGLIDRLDHIAGLGVDAIWVCPFYPSPQRDFGYDISDHCAVDPAFGRLEDVDRLIAAAHARGLRVLLDLVPQLLVERRALPGPGGAAAGPSLDPGLARRGHRRAPGRPGRPLQAVPLPHHHELRADLPQGPEPGQGDRFDQAADAGAARLTCHTPGNSGELGGSACGPWRRGCSGAC